MSRIATPDIQLKGFRLWVHGREFPEAQDFWTGNWLIISAELHTGHGWARVTRSAAMMASDFPRFLEEIRIKESDSSRPYWQVRLENPLERNFVWQFGRTANGMEAALTLTANPSRELHRACLTVLELEWQTFKGQLERLAENYPVRFEAGEEQGVQL